MIDGGEYTSAIKAVLNPLIDAICPRKIKEPKTRVGILIREMLEEQLCNHENFRDIIDRFIVGGAEADEKGTEEKLKKLHIKMGEILRKLAEGEG